ncbi:MAG: hypothetical protein AAF702_34645 [Chloroflexota bacterium]
MQIQGIWKYNNTQMVVAQFEDALMGNWLTDGGWFAKGSISNNSVKMLFQDSTGYNDTQTGTVSSDGKSIKWSNSTTWTR